MYLTQPIDFNRSRLWRYADDQGYSPCEGIPVTFQVGMVGSDGAVLASDTRALSTAGVQSGISAGVDCSSTTQKLFCYDELRCAYCVAGNDNTIRWIANGVHDRLKKLRESRLGSDEVKALLWDAVNEVCKPRMNEFGDPSSPRHYHVAGAMLLAYRGKDKVELWRIDLTGFAPGVNPVLDKVVQGDSANSAAFFLRYYRPVSVKGLLPIAAHCILTAGKMNPSGVEGLEIVVATIGETRKLEKQELEVLREASDRLEAAIYQHISQFYT
jgi:hypothetical protein